VVQEGLFAIGEQKTFSGRISSTISGIDPEMVHLHMIYYKVVDTSGVDYLAYAFDQVIFERFLDRIEKRDFFVYNEISVIGRSLRSGINRESRERSSHSADPVDVFF